ncbi:MAG TPA: sugar ABC transporter substrate-binding protein [Mycobacteriales bacterium]|nr:sugar ABC transporter substrate-binding protein [Mycobacteriales bacterium]
MKSKKFRTRIVSLASISLLALSAVTACSGGGNSGGGKTTVTWTTWGDPGELARYKQFDQQFMKTHPNINVVFQPVASYSDYNAKLLTELSSHTAPDVFYVGDDQIGKFVSTHQLEPLNNILDKSKTISAGLFAPGLYGAAKSGSTYYGVPTDCNPDAFWYNKTTLRDAGITQDPATLASEGKWTLSTFLSMVKTLHSHGIAGAGFWNYWSTPYSWISQYGGKIYNASGKFVLPQDPTSVQALTVLAHLFQNKTFDVLDTLPSGQSDTMFLTHKLGFYVQGRYTIATIKQGGNASDYDVAPWPSKTGKVMPSGVATAYLAINKSTPHQSAAATFLQAYVNAQGQTLRLAGGGNAVPSIKNTSADKVVLGYPAHARFLLQMRSLGFEDFAPEAAVPGLSTDMANVYLDLYQGKISVQQALTQLSALAAKESSR